MIFLKDLDYIFSLSLYIAKQSTTKLCIQTWIVTTQEKALATSALYLKRTSHNWNFL